MLTISANQELIRIKADRPYAYIAHITFQTLDEICIYAEKGGMYEIQEQHIKVEAKNLSGLDLNRTKYNWQSDSL